MAAPPTPPAKAGPSVLVVVLIVGVVVVAILGLLGAIAMPAFVRYTRRSKAAEADFVLSLLARSEETYFAEHRRYAPLPLRPAAPSCQPLQERPPPDPSWEQLDVDLEPPIRGAYEVIVGADGATYLARGFLDLDCDGEPSVRTRTSTSGVVQESGDRE